MTRASLPIPEPDPIPAPPPVQEPAPAPPPMPVAAPQPPPRRSEPVPVSPAPAGVRKPPGKPRRNIQHDDPPPPPRKKRSWLGLLARAALVLGVVGVAAAGGGYLWIEATYTKELPSIDALRAYEPATVTTVHAADGTLLGELYEERRYVLPFEKIPKHVQDAFVAAEDANFWNHDGIDYMGIARAMGRNLRAGRVSQGGSSITQQVAKNFLLTSDRTIDRKIKEAFLSWRIEEAYGKEHILYLYLNEIFLGSQAYGVEAASRTFFGKNVADITLAEAAILAGLPPRPSKWNPHHSIDAALERQSYVLGQMVEKGLISQADADAAKAQDIVVVPRGNTFREQAPHFTEYARRYLVDKYGEERVLKEGLQVTTTCDLEQQRIAQAAVTDGVYRVDQRMGFRRDAIEHLDSEAEWQARLQAYETKLREQWAYDQDPAGRVAVPAQSILEPGREYEGVITEVDKKWARVRVGSHEGILPLAWGKWLFVPDYERSWKYRKADDLLREVDSDGDGEKDGAILRVGDVIRVKVEALSTQAEDVVKDFKGTPGADASLVAIRPWQTPSVEAALLSIELDGAVRAMVGGADFSRSQFNRTNQALRQVGSTFKPIVYAAAIGSERITTATVLPDAPLALGTTGEDNEVWKPGNYGGDYLGNITVRKGLALSRNTITVRLVDQADPGLRTGVVYEFARKLGIGGTPLHLLPDGHVATPDNDHLCPWIPESSTTRSCMLRYPAKREDDDFAAHKARIKAGEEFFCQDCNLSMALGSASLTMEELARAYMVFANQGEFIQPHYILEVRDRDGNVLEQFEPVPPVQVIDPGVSTIATWLMQGVVDGGTAGRIRQSMRGAIAGKTGTTNDEKDAWFVGYTPEVITAVWVGFDQPAPMGPSSTGGQTALPIWIDFMEEIHPEKPATSFPQPDVEWAPVDEETGMRMDGGRSHPFLKGTIPEAATHRAGEVSLQDVTEL
jgi:penicillin-binding protein 1A